MEKFPIKFIRAVCKDGKIHLEGTEAFTFIPTPYKETTRWRRLTSSETREAKRLPNIQRMISEKKI